MTASSSGTMEWQHGRNPPPYSYDSPYHHDYHRGPPGYHSPYPAGPPSMHHYPHQRGPPPPPPHPHSRPDYWRSYESVPRRHWHHADGNRAHFEPPRPPSLPPMTHSGPPPHYARAPMRPPIYYDQSAPSAPREEYGGAHRGEAPPRPSLEPRGTKQRGRGESSQEVSARGDQGNEREQPPSSKQEKRDPLSLLAKVSTAMAPPQSRGKDQSSERTGNKEPAAPAPTSPLQRRLRASPIVANAKSSSQDELPQRAPQTPKPITPTGSRNPQYPYEEYQHAPPPPRGAYHYGGHPPPYSRHYPNYGDWESQHPPHAAPAVVERNSFDSETSAASSPDPRRYYQPYPATPESAEYHSPPGTWHPPHVGIYPQWSHDSGTPSQGYLPPHYTPPPYYRGPEDGDSYAADTNRSLPEGPATPYGPYSYVLQPNMEQKTMLKKKFSWKHYPELERFLIENRDEYLKHSSRNYTVEQKQFNNMLTERLLEVAEKYNYVFDPDDFNFVAIRDRIRCYYKSFVQTARKRGLPLPTDTERDEKKIKEEVETGEHEGHDDVETPSLEGAEQARSLEIASE